MSRDPCHIEGCEKESRGHGLCGTHWLRWRKYGDPYWGSAQDERGSSRKAWICSVDDCDRPHHAHGYCSHHAGQLRRHGDPLVYVGHIGRKRLAEPGYDAAHKRVSRERGPASVLSCVDCGGQAREWSYRGGSASELVCVRTGCAYSPLIEDYDPRCVRCHRLKDDSLKHAEFRNERGQFRRQT